MWLFYTTSVNMIIILAARGEQSISKLIHVLMISTMTILM